MKIYCSNQEWFNDGREMRNNEIGQPMGCLRLEQPTIYSINIYPSARDLQPHPALPRAPLMSLISCTSGSFQTFKKVAC